MATHLRPAQQIRYEDSTVYSKCAGKYGCSPISDRPKFMMTIQLTVLGVAQAIVLKLISVPTVYSSDIMLMYYQHAQVGSASRRSSFTYTFHSMSRFTFHISRGLTTRLPCAALPLSLPAKPGLRALTFHPATPIICLPVSPLTLAIKRTLGVKTATSMATDEPTRRVSMAWILGFSNKGPLKEVKPRPPPKQNEYVKMVRSHRLCPSNNALISYADDDSRSSDRMGR
jgi:hypothetical protein